MEYTFSNSTGTIRMSDRVEERAFGLYPASGNTCVIEVCLFNNPDHVDSVWHAWPLGNVTTDSMDVFYAACIAVRARRTAGSADGNRLIIYPEP